MQTKTQKQKLPPLPPADPLGAKFCKWFNHGWHWIYAEAPAPGQKPQWLTENRYPLEPRNLWQEYQDPEKIIGLRFDNEATQYCMIETDRGSSCHPANDLTRFNLVRTALEAVGLVRPLLIRSSDSEGIHIYYFLPEPVPTFSLACAIRFALEDAGLSLRPGQLEIFPNTKAYSKDKATDYNGHRLPLQAGSYWLDSDGLPISNDLGQFLDAANVASVNQDMVALHKALTAAAKNRHRLKSNFAPSQNSTAWKRNLEQRIAPGWTGHHQTNELLQSIAQYGHVFLGLEGDALVSYVETTARATPGYEQWCRHQHEIRSRAADWSQAVERWNSPYRSFPKRNGRTYKENFEQARNNIVKLENQANVSRQQLAAERIQQAMDHLKATDTLPYGATARAAAIIATLQELTGKGISPHTLYKDAHLPLWHPGQKSPEPAQGKTLHPTLEASSIEKSPEPAQGETLYPTPLYEGVGANARQPEPPPRGGGVLPGIVPFEHSSGEREGENVQSGTTGTVSSATPAAPDAPATPTAPTVPATPAAPTAPDAPIAPATPTASTAMTTPATPSAPTVPTIATGDSPQDSFRLAGIRLTARQQAKKIVSRQRGYSSFTPAERQQMQTKVMMQLLWDSGEPAWMYEVERWQTANPSVRLNLSSPGDKLLTGGIPPV